MSHNNKQSNHTIPIVAIALIAVIIIVVVLLASNSSTKSGMSAHSFQGTDDTVISQSGVHWHPELTILIKGQRQEIPANVGIGTQYASSKWYDAMMQMTDIHTHKTDGVLHWEIMQGPVKNGDAKLGNFFEIWDKPFNKDQILDAKNGDGRTVKMTVNGQSNTEFENYIIHDGDKIEIRFE